MTRVRVTHSVAVYAQYQYQVVAHAYNIAHAIHECNDIIDALHTLEQQQAQNPSIYYTINNVKGAQ
jgi:hypothetical protein